MSDKVNDPQNPFSLHKMFSEKLSSRYGHGSQTVLDVLEQATEEEF